MRLRYLFILIFFFHHLVNGQNTIIHLDKPFYFAGEYLFYSFCNLDLPQDTVMVRVDLYHNKFTVDYYFLPIRDQCGEGFFKLPFDLEGDIYRLMFWVVSQKNFETFQIGGVDIPVYNDNEDYHKLPLRVNKASSIKPFIPGDPVAVFDNRQTVNLDLTLPVPEDQIHRVSVVIRDLSAYGTRDNTVSYSVADLKREDLIKGIPVFGTRLVEDVKTFKNPLLFAFNPGNMQYNGTKVDPNDQFNLELQPFYGENEISFLDYVDNEIKIIEKNKFQPIPVESHLEIDSVILAQLKNYREEKQINRLFKQIAISPTVDSLAVSLRKKPNSLVDVQDYSIRGTTTDLFKEISTNLKFRSSGGPDYRARMIYEYNGITKFYSRSPLFLVNGKATRDGNFIARLPLQEIGYFRIYSDYEFLEKLSPMAHGGIVYVDMLDRNYVLPDQNSLPAINVKGMQPPLQYPVYQQIQPETPAIGNLLYWNPDTRPENNQVRLQFQTGDLASEYLVEMVLYKKEAGSAETIRRIIRVDGANN